MNWKLFWILWLSGLPGVVALAWVVVPMLPAPHPLPAPAWVLSLASGLQSGLLLTIAVFLGVRLAPRIGLGAPVVTAMLAGQSTWAVMRPRVAPALVGGLLGMTVLWAFDRYAPGALGDVRSRFSLPLGVRVLYGGITEELLLRWGLMTVLAWLAWRYLQRGAGALSPFAAWMSIAVSALAFAVGHLPAASAMTGGLTADMIASVILGNAAFGIVAGYLFWRHGLETAMGAHVLAHVGFFAAFEAT